MSNISKEELHDLVFVTAHNSGQLNEEVIRLIADFNVPTYRRLLDLRLELREEADITGNEKGVRDIIHDQIWSSGTFLAASLASSRSRPAAALPQ